MLHQARFVGITQKQLCSVLIFLWLFAASLRFYLFGFSFKFCSEYDGLQSGHFMKVKLTEVYLKQGRVYGQR